MTNFNLPEEFSQKKSEMIMLADKYKTLNIDGVDDVEGYKKVDIARKELKSARRDVERFGEAYYKILLTRQNEEKTEVKDKIAEYVGIVSSEEERLCIMQKAIDEEILINERRKLLPERRLELKKINVIISDEEILKMTHDEFTEFFNTSYSEFLKKKEDELKAKEDEVARMAEIENAKKEARIKAEKEAKEEAIEKAKEAKEAMLNAVKEAEAKAEKEKQELIDKQKQEAKEKLEQEELKKKEEAKAKEKLEKEKNYRKWQTDNGVTEENKEEFYFLNTGSEVIMYKKVSTFKL